MSISFVLGQNFSRYFKLQQILQTSADTSNFSRYFKLQQVLQTSVDVSNISRYFKLQQILQTSADSSNFSRSFKLQQILQNSADTSTDKIIMTCFSSWLLRSMSASLVIGNFSARIITVVSTSYTAPAWKQ